MKISQRDQNFKSQVKLVNWQNTKKYGIGHRYWGKYGIGYRYWGKYGIGYWENVKNGQKTVLLRKQI